MNIQRTGIILNVQNFEACVAFYRNLFGLPVLFEKEEGEFRLTCLGLGDAYLMIETDGVAKSEGKTVAENATKLRINVDDIDKALSEVRAYGIEADIISNEWGSTINIFDPDGNRVGIRDEATFEQ